MVANVKDKAVIVGIGNTEFSKNSGVSELSLACQAIKAACDDAGLHPLDVVGHVETAARDSRLTNGSLSWIFGL